jgi:hypothetical protein
MSKSPFIDASKHKEMTSTVEGHFFGADSGGAPGGDSGKGMQRGMTSDWDTSPMPIYSGLVNSAPTGAPAGPSIFNDNIERVPIPKDTGVNYKPLSQAGHNQMADKPFGGARDGYPGNTPGTSVKKLIWD